MSLLRERAGASEEEEEEKERRLWNLYTIIQLQAKSQWYGGLFDAAEELAVEASDLAPQIAMDGDGGGGENGEWGLRQGCSVNALALSKLAALDIREERVVKLYQDDAEPVGSTTDTMEEEDTRDWSKILRESDELKDMLDRASYAMFNEYSFMKRTTNVLNNSNNSNSNSSNITDTTTTRLPKKFDNGETSTSQCRILLQSGNRGTILSHRKTSSHGSDRIHRSSDAHLEGGDYRA